MDEDNQWDRAQRATLLRMKRALDKGCGVRISHSELAALDISFLGEVWAGIADDARLGNDRQPLPTLSA